MRSCRAPRAAERRELATYNYFRRNAAGVQREWWYHRAGCRTWFLAERDTRTNEVLEVRLPERGEREAERAAGHDGASG